ncbi:MAG: PAS domain S-box protein [Cyclobacteriaceae bacterium]
MKELERSIKKRSVIFISTITLVIIIALIMVQSKVNDQKNGAYLINISGKQRALSQNIAKIAFALDSYQEEPVKTHFTNSLKTSIDELENTHSYLYSENQQNKNNATIDSLLKAAEPYLESILTSGRNIIVNVDSGSIKQDVAIIAAAEVSFLAIMDALVSQYQNEAEKSVQKLIGTIYLMVLVAGLIFVGEFLFVLVPTLRQIFRQRMSENKFRDLLESAPDAIVIVNEKGKVQLINKQAERLFGYSAEELVDKPVELLIPKRFIENHAEYRAGFFANPKVRGMGVGRGQELFGITKEGKEIPVQISLSPLQTGEGLLVSAAIRDVTEQKLAESELLRKNHLLSFAEKITKIGTWKWDIITNEVKWSANLYDIFGREPDTALTYDTYFGYVHPDDKQRVTDHVEKSFVDKKFIDLMHRIKLADGTVKTIQLLAEIITDNKGEIIEMIGTCQDVTVQRMAENKFRGLLESAPDAMVILDESYSIELVNSGVEKIFGYSRSELIGNPANILLADSSGSNPFQVDANSMNQEKIVKLGVDSDILAVKKDGTKFPVEINLGTLKTDDELLISAAIRDITKRKETEVKLRSIAALQAKNEEMEQLSYITSHDLKEPLLTIKKYSQVLQDECQTMGENEEFVLGAIIRSAERMETKIKDLLEYSQLGYGHKFEIIDCAATLKTVIEDLNSLIEANSAEVVIGNLPSTITAYATGLQLIFQNLINNAIKFRKKDIVPKVFISSKKKEGGWEFVVEDNGIGIDEKDFNKIFSIFKRLHNHSDYTGSGVGLAHVKKLVELHNGQVWVQSKPAGGTAFHFSIITETL